MLLSMGVQDAIQLIQLEYEETPEICLTFAQVRHLCELPNDLCERALGALTLSGFLVRTPDGAFVRHGTVSWARAQAGRH
jgi:hypothetical protein